MNPYVDVGGPQNAPCDRPHSILGILLHPSAQDDQLAEWAKATGAEAKAATVPNANRLIQDAAAHLNHVNYQGFASSPVRGLPPA